jgi:hypothetical protein
MRIDYSGCQKNVPLSQRFFLQPLIPQFIVSELYYGKRYIKLEGLEAMKQGGSEEIKKYTSGYLF